MTNEPNKSPLKPQDQVSSVNEATDKMTTGMYKILQGTESGMFAHNSNGIVAKITNIFKGKK